MSETVIHVIRTYGSAVIELIGAVGSIASVVTLILASQVARRLREQQLQYVRQATLPRYIDHLEGYLKNLEQALSQKSSERMRKNCALCCSTLRSILPFVDASLARRIQSAVALTESTSKNASDAEVYRQCGVVVNELHGVLRSVQNLQLELPWRLQSG